jgi:outer membrane protein OmpA-like peptidoglycan-associated protein
MKKKVDIEYQEHDENAFSLSTGDLMSGLLFIFILLLMGALLQVQEKAEQDEEIVRQYDQIKTQLYIDLQDEFKDDLKTWSATIDSTLCVRFQEPSTLFDNNEATLKKKFKDILDDFFPRYIAVWRFVLKDIRIVMASTFTIWNSLRIELVLYFNIAWR